MRSIGTAVIVLSMLVGLGGCQGGKVVNSQEAASRVDAALEISNPTERDEALASACRDAAEAGAGEAVLKGIDALGLPSTRDEVIGDCAQRLQNAGQGAAANEVARQIRNPTKRDEVLKKLATGS